MIKGQTVLAVIPARGGSKRCPRKNIRDYKGKPLIGWALDAARGSKYIDEIILSTEDDEIKRIACDLGAIVQVRPNELATDDASNEDVMRYVLQSHPADWVVLLQPSSPQRTSQHIDECLERAQMGLGCVSYNRKGSMKNGAVYVATAEWLAKHDFSHDGLMRYVMDQEVSLDIDHPEQFNE